MSNRCCAFLLVLMLAAACLPLAAQTYSLQAFSYPHVPNTDTRAMGINDRGAVVGYFSYVTHNGSAALRGFKRDANGIFERPIDDITGPGTHYYTVPNGINDSGVVSGYYIEYLNGGSGFSGFLLSQGVFTDFSIPPGIDTKVFGINNQGDFVGYHGGSDGRYYVTVNGVSTPLDYPHSTIIEADGIAADGTIVGTFRRNYGTDHSFWGFLRGPAAKYKPFKIPGSFRTMAYGVSSATHQIVGYYTSSPGTLGLGHGFVYDYISGTFTTVDWPPGPKIIQTVVTGINSQGTIVGYVLSHDPQTNAWSAISFIGTPQ